MNVKRGELYYADLSPVVGSEQGGIRPVLVVQNDVGNKYSPTIIAAAVTSKLNKERIGELPPATMHRVNRAILISLGFPVNN